MAVWSTALVSIILIVVYCTFDCGSTLMLIRQYRLARRLAFSLHEEIAVSTSSEGRSHEKY